MRPEFIVFGIILATSVILFDWDIAIFSMVLGCGLTQIAYTDYRRFIIPDIISLPLMPLGLLVSWYLFHNHYIYGNIIEHLLAMLFGMAALYAIRWLYKIYRGREGLGLGDVKLAGVAGAWTGIIGLNYVILLACISALIIVTGRQLLGQVKLKPTTAIPLGIFLSPAIWVVWVLLVLNQL